MALGLARHRRKICNAYGKKDLAERRVILLRHMVVNIRPEDVTAQMQHLDLRPSKLPAAVLHTDVNVEKIQPLLSHDAWRKLKAAIRQRAHSDTWSCACCNKDLGSECSVECSSCLDSNESVNATGSAVSVHSERAGM